VSTSVHTPPLAHGVLHNDAEQSAPPKPGAVEQSQVSGAMQVPPF
jgi:hypothetical protein